MSPDRLHRGLLAALLAVAALAAVASPAAAVAGVGLDADLGVPLVPVTTARPPLAPPGMPVEVDVSLRAGGDASGARAAGEPSRASHPPEPDAEAADEPLAKGVVTPAGRALVGAAGLAAMGVLRWALAGGVGLFARIGRGEVLDNRARDAVYRAIVETPGLSPTELHARLKLGWGTVVYHLDRLERNGYVTSARAGLARRYFAVGAVAPAERAGAARLRDAALSRLASRVAREPGLQQGAYAAALGLSASAAAKQLAKLEDAGLVTREREGRVARVVPTAQLAALVAAAPHEPAAAPAAGDGPALRAEG